MIPILFNRRGGGGGAAAVVTPTAWLDPGLRVFQNIVGTTPATANGDKIQNWTTADGEALVTGGDTAGVLLQTVGGKKAVDSWGASASVSVNLVGSVANVVRPPAYDLLYAFRAAPASGGSFSSAVGMVGNSTNVWNPSSRRTVDDSTGILQIYAPIVRRWSAIGGAAVTTGIGSSGAPLVGGLADAWHWVRLTVTPGVARMRLYSGPGTLLADQSTAGANGDEVLDTGGSFTTTIPFLCRRTLLGRVYRRPSSLFTDQEVSAIFADSGYP